jgi:hypothetical protein
VRALLVALAIAQAGCFTIVGTVTGGIIVDRQNAARLARAERGRPLAVEAPARPILTAESKARCEHVRTTIAAEASHLTNSNAQHAVILRLPNCMDPTWEFPDVRPTPQPLPRPPPPPEMRSIGEGMAVGAAIGLLVDITVLVVVAVELLEHPTH